MSFLKQEIEAVKKDVAVLQAMLERTNKNALEALTLINVLGEIVSILTQLAPPEMEKDILALVQKLAAEEAPDEPERH